MAPTQQVLLFCLVGITNTAVDFAIFNLLTRSALGWRRIPANLVSVSVAMTWSFLANGYLVFHPEGNAWMERAGRFLVTTAFSAFVLQNVILHLTTCVWKWPVGVVIARFRELGLPRRFDDDMIARNTCKVMAVSGGLIWNFYWYKFFVYAT